MLFRRSASLVDAVRIDGTEAALKAVMAMPRAAVGTRGGEMEVATSCGRRVAQRGSWVTRDVTTRSIRLYDDVRFQAVHEAVR